MITRPKDEILIAMVGSDERPAGIADLDDFKKSLEETIADTNTAFVTHHAVTFESIGRPEDDKVLVIKLGSDERPAGPQDIQETQDRIEAQEGVDWGCIVTHHAVSFSEIDRKSISKGMIVI
jgi:hypothetical protein